jgi:hypothetical protein
MPVGPNIQKPAATPYGVQTGNPNANKPPAMGPGTMAPAPPTTPMTAGPSVGPQTDQAAKQAVMATQAARGMAPALLGPSGAPPSSYPSLAPPAAPTPGGAYPSLAPPPSGAPSAPTSPLAVGSRVHPLARLQEAGVGTPAAMQDIREARRGTVDTSGMGGPAADALQALQARWQPVRDARTNLDAARAMRGTGESPDAGMALRQDQQALRAARFGARHPGQLGGGGGGGGIRTIRPPLATRSMSR